MAPNANFAKSSERYVRKPISFSDGLWFHRRLAFDGIAVQYTTTAGTPRAIGSEMLRRKSCYWHEPEMPCDTIRFPRAILRI